MTTERLPDWLIVGAAKSGTTSLSAWLGRHPEVYAVAKKELHFFDRSFHLGPQHYAEEFREARPDQVAGEATPDYLYDPAVPERVRAVVPDARLVAVLRHPVDRAYSHYWHARNWGAQLPDFPRVVDAVLEGDETHAHLLARGYYAEQLERWAACDLRPQVHLFEDLAAAPQQVFSLTCEHLGISMQELPAVGSVWNRSHRRRSPRVRRAMERARMWQWAPTTARRLDRANTVEVDYPPLDSRTRDRLLAHFAPHTLRLEAHLGRPLPGWDR